MNSELLATVERYESNIAEFASESIVILDEDGIIHYWNPAAERLFGWPALAIVGSDIAELAPFPHDEQQSWSQLMQEGAWQGRINRKTLAGKVISTHVRRHLRYAAGGKDLHVVEFAHPTADGYILANNSEAIPDGLMAASWEIDVSSAMSVLEDIAASTSLEDQAELDSLYSDLVESARIVEVNERTARLVGGNRGKALLAGQSVASCWPVGSRKILAELIVEALASEDGRSCCRQLASDGILRDPLVTVWRGRTGRSGHLFIAVNGAADDDRSYLYLRASEARYRKLVDHMPVALWQVDASQMGKIYSELRAEGIVDFERYLQQHPELVEYAASSVPVTDVNLSAIELVGGKGVQDLIRPVGYLFAESPDSLRRVMIGRFSGQKSYSELMKVRTLDSRVLDVRFSVTYPEPLLELDTTIFSLEDVTDRLRTETQLRQLQTDFSHAARISVLGELTSSIAHEVNQPLSAIMTNAETSLRWLERDEPNLGKVAQLTARIAASARRADDIVQRIRGMAVKQVPEPVQLMMNEIVQESLLFIRHEIETRAVRVEANYGRGVPPVFGDRIQLQQVIVNVLINAVQAVESCNEAQREIAVTTSTDARGNVIFILRDRGPGIAPDHLEHIFAGFFTTKTQGMGIGLAICRSIVMGHGGEISASNRQGGGAEFRILLPRAGTPTGAGKLVDTGFPAFA